MQVKDPNTYAFTLSVKVSDNFEQETKSFGTFTGALGYVRYANCVEVAWRSLIEAGFKNDAMTVSIAEQLVIYGDATESGSSVSFTLASIADALAGLFHGTHGEKLTSVISDGDHTFDDLYRHRCTLFACLVRVMSVDSSNFPVSDCWFSLLHHDGSYLEGYIIVGIGTDMGNCTYHMKADEFETLLRDAGVKERDRAPEWDGHTSDDVLNRLVETFLSD